MVGGMTKFNCPLHLERCTPTCRYYSSIKKGCRLISEFKEELEMKANEKIGEPKLREKIVEILCGFCGDECSQEVRGEEEGCKELIEGIDQVLALIPDKLPTGEPPLTCEVHITEEVGASYDTDYMIIKRCVTGCPACQAKIQREADIKFYRGE